jgi:hypothetical protein
MPDSIQNCLTLRLPTFDTRYDPDSKVDEGALSTKTMPAPKMAIPRCDDNRWFKLGAMDLDSSIVTPASFAGQVKHMRDQANKRHPNNKADLEILGFAKAFHENENFVPDKEIGITHSNEADVVRSAGLYLIHPVMQAMAAHPRYYKEILSKSEVHKGKTRTDMAFYQFDKNSEARPFAVVEYKKRESFQGDEFRHEKAIKNIVPSSWKADLQKKYDEILMPYPRDRVGQQNHRASSEQAFKELVKHCRLEDQGATMFDKSALNAIKQASSYMVSYGVRYVALFNWDCLVLCYFPWLDLDKSSKVLAGEYRDIKKTRNNPGKEGKVYPVEVDIYDHNGPDGPNMRLALMSFMQHAWEETYSYYR